MKNEAKARLKGPLLINEEQLRKVYTLVDSMRKKDLKSSTKGSLTYAPTSITIELKDDQKYIVDDIDDVFKIENRRNNAIFEISMRGSPFSTSKADITLNNYWFRPYGAEIRVSGDIEDNKKAVSEFYSILQRNNGVFISILSTNPLALSVTLVLIFNFLLGLLSYNNLYYIYHFAHNGEIANILLYLLFFWIMPTLSINFIIQMAILRWIGRAIFTWDDGQANFEYKKTIISFFAYTLPVAVAGKFVASLFLGK